MTKIVVYHSGYGCDTGCCGHVVEKGLKSHFFFDHAKPGKELEFAKELVREEFGEKHVADLDWENSFIVNEDQDY